LSVKIDGYGRMGNRERERERERERKRERDGWVKIGMTKVTQQE
jgi:hypothetical protein